MKIFSFLILVLFSTVIFSISINAQTEKNSIDTSIKIASVNPKAFDNGELGIKDLTNAYDNLEAELQPQIDELKTRSLELQKLQTEVENYQKMLSKERKIGCYEPVVSKAKAKYEEYQKLFLEFKGKQESYKLLQEKRESEVITPIKNKIGDALKQFAKEKGYTAILDIKSLSCDCIYEETTPDITAEFIKFYNDLSEKEKAQ